jgi:hypothetical protein
LSTEAAFALTPTPVRRSSLVFAAVFGALALLTACVAFVPHMEFVALSAVYAGALLAYLSLRTDRQGGHLFEVVILIGVLSFLFFCVGTMYLVIVPQDLDFPSLGPYLLAAQALATLGFLCFLVGYGGFFRRTAPSPLGRLVPHSLLFYILPALGGALGMSVQRSEVRGGQSISASLSFLQQFSSLFFFAWFLSWYMTWAKKLRMAIAVPMLVALSGIASLVLFFTFGGKGLAATLLVMPAIAYYEVTRKLPTKSIVAIALVFVFVIFPMYNNFRQMDRNLDVSRRADRSIAMARTWDADKYLDATVFAFLKRIAIVTSVAAIVSDTGRWVPYRYGDTLILAPIGLLIPRFLWPDKPIVGIGREFGETFRLKSGLDRETSIAPSMVGDLYWNFSVPGVVVGMWLLGMGYRWYYQRYGAGAGFDPIRKSIYFTLLPTAMSFEGNVAIALGVVVKTLVVLVVFVVLSRRLGWLDELAF